jgi:hypothetical protein
VAEGEALDPDVRLFVLTHFLEHARPPLVEEIAIRFGFGLDAAAAALERLEAGRHLARVPGTSRILMAFPLSAIATPYRVHSPHGRSYYANCAWDAIAFHAMLRHPLRVESYCHHCGAPVRIELVEGQARSPDGVLPVLYFGLPASKWWRDIVHTCGAEMIFFSSETHLAEWKGKHPEESGEMVTVPQTIGLSVPIYSRKLERGYARPSREEVAQLFESLGLTGRFWKL